MSLLLFLSGFSVSSCAAWVRKLTERTKWHQFFSPLNIVSGCWNSCLHGFTQTSFLQINRNNPMVENSSWSIWRMSNCVCMWFPLALLHKKHMSAPHTSLWNLSNSIWHLVGPVSYVHWIKKNCFSLGVFHDCVCERKMKTQRDRRNKRQNNNYVPQGQSFKFTGINVISFPPFTANCYTHNDMHVFLRR